MNFFHLFSKLRIDKLACGVADHLETREKTGLSRVAFERPGPAIKPIGETFFFLYL